MKMFWNDVVKGLFNKCRVDFSLAHFLRNSFYQMMSGNE